MANQMTGSEHGSSGEPSEALVLSEVTKARIKNDLAPFSKLADEGVDLSIYGIVPHSVFIELFKRHVALSSNVSE